MEDIIKPNLSSSNQAGAVSKDGPRINEQITSPKVRLILSDGENVGVVPTSEAIRRANELGLDLIEIAPNGEIPVCKILDSGKYKYEMQKRKAEAKKKQKVQETKEIKFTPNIGDNDYSVKMRSAKRFLEEGNKVKFTLRFRGREMSYVDLGMEVLRRAKSELEDVAKVDQEPKMDGRQMAMMMSPK
ncbi:MAG: translation initiation factor IF-3 [Alphaproteobacteria bacterium]|nr:translation initiation factor IF-3 [Alphaproteobacteria bacterium]